MVITLAAVLLLAFAVRLLPPKPSPDIPSQPSPTTAPATASSAAPTPTPTATPAEALLPPGGDARGCPRDPGNIVLWDYDASDPFCRKRHNQYAYDSYYAGNPAYDCSDGRNNGLGPADLDKFVPCLNGTLRLEVQYGRVTLYTTTDKKVKLYTNTPRDGVPSPSSDTPWVIWQSDTKNDGTGAFFRIHYFSYTELRFYNGYYRKGAGKWNLMINLGDEKFSPSELYQVVLFWNDPNAAGSDDVPLPPAFSWGEVDKHKP